MKVFVSGADGFVGSHLVEELVARGHRVTALAQYNSFNSIGWLASISEEAKASVNVVLGDVRDAGFMHSAIAGHSHVAHLAALIAIPFSYRSPASYVQTNVEGTLNVLESCRRNGVERLIHTSTSEVYGTAQYVPINEAHPVVGQSPYSASKIGADQLAHSYWSSFGVPVVTLRPFNTYGPRQSQRAFIPSVAVQLLAKVPRINLGSLSPTRDLTFVSDTARGFADVMLSDSGVGQTFNMGSGFEVSMRKVFDTLCEIAGSFPEVVLDAERVRPEVSEVERLLSDSSKILETFGWEPRYGHEKGLRRGLEATYEWLAGASFGGYSAKKYVV